MNTRILILAAGQSTRMNGVPKMLMDVGGTPMLVRVVEAATASGIDRHPLVVVGVHADAIRAALDARCDYVVQEEQRGTGHAVQCAELALRGKADAVLVLYGDNCMIQPNTTRLLAETCEKTGAAITMLTTTVLDFEEWRQPFADFGRVVRNADGAIMKSVEKKDATSEELAIRELNPSFYCFNAAWLWENLKKVQPHNAQGEYYLTDLVQIAIAEGAKVEAIPVAAQEVIGVNTKEQLEIVRKLAASTQ
jgi:bifunctional UDP-N-acetylglucosamine pyrophosphorylase/glucosamine-1-phosphate N-acetyltransferase